MAKLSKYLELLNNTLVFGLGALGSKLILFFLVPLYTNNMSTAEYGVADFITTAVTFVVPLATLSIQESLFRFAFDSSIEKTDLLKCFYCVIAVSSIIVFAFAFGFHWIEYFSGFEALFFILSMLTILRDAYALFVKACERTRLFAIDAVLYVIWLLLANIVLLVVFHLGVSGYLLSMIVAKAISLCFLFGFSGLPGLLVPFSINRSLLKRMVSYSAPMVMNSISWWIMSYANRYLIGFFLNASSMGLFSIAGKIPSLVSTFVSIFNQSWVISSVKEFEGEKSTNLYGNVFAVFDCGVTILTAFVIVIIGPFMDLYVGSDFLPATPAVPFLLLGALYLAYTSFFGIIFNSAKQTKALMTSSVWGAATNVVVAIILIPLIGINGASIATAVSYFVTFIYRLVKSREYIRFDLHLPKFVCGNFLVLLLCVVRVAFGDAWPMLMALFLAICLINTGTVIRFTKFGFAVCRDIFRNR